MARVLQGAVERSGRVAQFPTAARHDAAPVLDGGDVLSQPYEVRTLASPLLTVDQVAERLTIPRKSVYEAIYHHGLPVRRVGRLVRVHPDELEAWTRAHRLPVSTGRRRRG